MVSATHSTGYFTEAVRATEFLFGLAEHALANPRELVYSVCAISLFIVTTVINGCLLVGLLALWGAMLCLRSSASVIISLSRTAGTPIARGLLSTRNTGPSLALMIAALKTLFRA